MERGLEVHRRARDLYPDGKLISDPNTARAAETTSQLMADPSVTTLFEATFQVDGYTAKADVLSRHKGGWHLIEVKSNVNDKPELVDDLTYTVMVAQRAGCSICRASLKLVSKDYRLGQSDEDLFREIDHTEDARQRATEFLALWSEIADAISRDDRPVPQLVLECRDCQYFARECIGKGVANSIFDLPRLSRPKVVSLAQTGTVSIEDIPDGFALTENQKRVYDVIISGNPAIGPNLGKTVSDVEWPAYYLDFETVMTAIPLYPDVAPYEQIPTQFSIHVCTEAGHIREHHQFLADPSKDPRPDLAASLVEALGDSGSILAYSSFEKKRIDDLAKACPNRGAHVVLKRRSVQATTLLGHLADSDTNGYSYVTKDERCLHVMTIKGDSVSFLEFKRVRSSHSV